VAVLTSPEIEAIRFHLGYGNLAVGAYPWTPDGFFELFTNVIAVYLTDIPPTSAATAIDASAGPVVATVTPASMAITLPDGTSSVISPNMRLIVDNDDDAEIVVVKSTTVTTFSARFTNSHDVSGYPVAVEVGTSRLRYLLHRANRVHEAMFGRLVTTTAGIQSIDNGEVVWFGQNSVIKGMYTQYQAIVAEISSLVRVDPVQIGGGGNPSRMEAY